MTTLERRRLAQRKWAQKNRERNRAYAKTYRNKNKQKIRLYYKEWYRKNGRVRSEDYMRVVEEWIEKNPDGHKAHIILNNAVKTGRIPRPEECCECNAIGRLHAHHEDYSKPLDVMWLCASCHKLKHRP